MYTYLPYLIVDNLMNQIKFLFYFFIENQPPVGPRGRNILSYSLQTSPTRNFMDPIDFNNLASSRYNSTENLFNSLPCESTNNSGLSSRWRSSRRSLRSSRRGMYKDCNYSGQFLALSKSCETQDKIPNFLRDLQDCKT